MAIKLDAGQSFVWNGDNANCMTAVFNATQDADAASDTAFGSLKNVQAEIEMQLNFRNTLVNQDDKKLAKLLSIFYLNLIGIFQILKV